MSDNFCTFAMSYFCSFPPKFTFPRCSEEFLFPSTKIRNIYYTDNQLVIFLSLFRDCPYIMSDSVQTDLFVNGVKSPSVIRMESAMRKQLEPNEEDTSYHRLKCIDENTIREFLSRRLRYEYEVANGIEPKSMIIR